MYRIITTRLIGFDIFWVALYRYELYLLYNYAISEDFEGQGSSFMSITASVRTRTLLDVNHKFLDSYTK